MIGVATSGGCTPKRRRAYMLSLTAREKYFYSEPATATAELIKRNEYEATVYCVYPNDSYPQQCLG